MTGRGRVASRPRDGQCATPRRPGTGSEGNSRDDGVTRETAAAALLPADENRGSTQGIMGASSVQTNTVFNKRAAFQPATQLFSNYFELQSRPDMHLFQYNVEFSPDVEITRARYALIYQHQHLFSKHVFDGTSLFCPTRLEKDPMEAPVNRKDGSVVMVRYKLVGEVFKHDQTYNQVMNIIVRTCLRKLNLVMMRRDYFDPQAATTIQQHNLSIWPGYTTTIRQYDGGYLLNVGIRHKIVRSDTVHDAMMKIYRKYEDSFEQRVRSEIVGKIVMTIYNKKTYRIDDVDFDQNPNHTFRIKKEDREISYVEYYQKRWNLVIRDVRQPLLLVRPSRRDINRGDTEPNFLIPELCVMTGLSDEQLSNIRLKNDVGAKTRLNPTDRVERLLRFRRRLADTPAVLPLYLTT